MTTPAVRITLAFLVTRVLLVVATLISWPLDPCLRYEVSAGPGLPPVEVVVPWRTDAQGERDYLPGDPPEVLDALARMDAEYYLAIAAFGYGRNEDGTLAQRDGFFPGYPMAIRGVAHVINALSGRPGVALTDAPMNILVAAFVVSNLALLCAALLLYRMAHRYFDPRISEHAALWLLCCPVAFFGSAYLAESLFLVLSIASIACALSRRMALAALLGAAAAFTRPVGVLLVVPLFLISFRGRAEGRSVMRDSCLLLLVPAGVALVFLWHQQATGDPWAYMAIQRAYGHDGVDLAGLIDLFRVGGKNPLELARDGIQVAAILAAAGCLLALVRARKAPAALAIWALILAVFVLLSGHLISVPRYLFSAFPFFIGAALLFAPGRFGRPALVASVAAQIAGFVVFMRAWPILI